MPKALRLTDKLVLNQWALRLFGCECFDQLAEHLRDDALEGLDSEEIHRLGRALMLHIPAAQRPTLPDDELLRHDAAIVRATRDMNEPRIRGGLRPIQWKYFQYLSLLFTEIYLERYFADAATLREALNTSIVRFNEGKPKRDHLDPLDESGEARSQLNKLSFWMATGSGKTLLMHAQIRLFERHLERANRRRELGRILLITPNEGLSRQHLREFVASGIHARLFDKQAGSMFRDQMVEILEVSRLGDAMGDKVVAVEALEGKNLVLIDEGHRGLSAGKGNKLGAWLRRRDQLCEKGFSFEYSATFGHAIKGNAEQKRNLTHRYATSVLFDYSYRWFHGDGFGKDYAIFNLKEKKNAPDQSEDWRRDYLTAALLSFLQQQRVFRRSQGQLRPFGIERPLWVFVGGSVTKGLGEKETSDILDILGFLRDHARDREDATARIRRILTEGLPEISDNSLFSDHFRPLRDAGLTPAEIYGETLESLFNAPGGGGLHIERLKGSGGELALRIGDNDPFGVINVGAPADLRKHCLAEGFDATEREFSGSLFHELNDAGSSVHLLVGAKKFTEGWSSWRVSSMGLMNVGRSEGAQIIQLFGRGVRLRGKDASLKRSSALPEASTTAPPDIRYLETLQVFGVRANYMAHFREILHDEGVAVKRRRVTVPVEIREPEVPLKVPRVTERVAGDDPATAFRRRGPVLVLRPPQPIGPPEDRAGDTSRRSIREQTDEYLRRRRILVDWYPRIQALHSPEGNSGAQRIEADEDHPFRPEHLDHLDFDRLYFDLQRFKSERGWHNLTISRALLPVILVGRLSDDGRPCHGRVDWYQLRIPQREMEFRGHTTIRNWQEIAFAVLARYATRYYSAARQAWEARHLDYRTVRPSDPLYPRVAESRTEYGHTVEVKGDDPDQDKRLVRQIKEWTEDMTREGPKELQGLNLDFHLYTPLLHTPVRKGTSPKVIVTPDGLNDGEARFVDHLREFCDRNPDRLEGWTLYLARNPSRGHGVHFFEASNFHPDFILWAVKDGVQQIAFIDPKGLVHENPDSPKIMLCQTIKDIENKLRDRAIEKKGEDPGIHLDSFIVSVTTRAELEKLWGRRDPRYFAERHIVFQKEGSDIYIREILEGMSVIA